MKSSAEKCYSLSVATSRGRERDQRGGLIAKKPVKGSFGSEYNWMMAASRTGVNAPGLCTLWREFAWNSPHAENRHGESEFAGSVALIYAYFKARHSKTRWLDKKEQFWVVFLQQVKLANHFKEEIEVFSAFGNYVRFYDVIIFRSFANKCRNNVKLQNVAKKSGFFASCY